MIRRTVRALPPLQKRDDRIAELREQLRESKAEANELRCELAAAQKKADKPADGGTDVTDAQGAMPRAKLPGSVVTLLRAHGLSNTGGTQKDDARGYPSFVTKLFEVRRYTSIVRRTEVPHPRPHIADKLRTLALAASHGVTVPTVHGLWHRVEDIDLSGMPEEFVLKSNFGAGSRGVIPLRRVPGQPDRLAVADNTGRVLSNEEIVEWMSGDRVAGPWYVEEMLKRDDGGEGVPPDYKLYCFYGEIGGGFVRQTKEHFGVKGFQNSMRFHYFDGDGNDSEWRVERSDQTIPLSPLLPEILETGRKLSKVVPLPFIRVDLYATTKGVVMGELTLGPGGRQYLKAEQDVRFGREWERAQVRMESDLYTGARPYGMVIGDQEVPELLRPFLPETH